MVKSTWLELKKFGEINNVSTTHQLHNTHHRRLFYTSADKLKSTIADFKGNLKGNTIKIHSKDYADVAFRVGMLRKNLGLDATIKSELLYHDDKKVIVRSEIWIDGKLISTGLAEELKSSSRINQLSSLEVAETSAVGRAAAFAGLTNDNIASSNEVSNAIVASDIKLTTALAELDKVSHLGAYKSWLTTNQKLMQDVKASNAHAWQEFLEKFNQIKNKLETNGVIQ